MQVWFTLQTYLQNKNEKIPIANIFNVFKLVYLITKLLYLRQAKQSFILQKNFECRIHIAICELNYQVEN